MYLYFCDNFLLKDSRLLKTNLSVVSSVAFDERPRYRDTQTRTPRAESRTWRDDETTLQESFTLLKISTNDIPKVIGGYCYFYIHDHYNLRLWYTLGNYAGKAGQTIQQIEKDSGARVKVSSRSAGCVLNIYLRYGPIVVHIYTDMNSALV